MILSTGGIVRSSAGHDKGKYFIVVGAEGDNYLLLADGKFRPIEKPKKKKESIAGFAPDAAAIKSRKSWQTALR